MQKSVAIVGSGPSGCYLAQALLKALTGTADGATPASSAGG